MKRFTFFIVFFLIFSFLLVGCGGGQDSPADEPSSKEDVKTEDAEDLLLTEKEVKSYLKAAPAYVKVMKELSEKYEGINTKNVMRGAVAAKKALREINSTLKPYGFTMESFFAVQAKVLGTYGYMMGLEAKKQTLPQLKEMLNNPNIPEEQKEEIKESIKEMEEVEDTEESKVYRKNMKIVKEYKGKLDDLFSKLKEID